MSPNIAWIIITTARVQPLTDALIKSLVTARINNLRIYQVKNREGYDGYAHGVNIGIREALIHKPNNIIVSNPDIALNKRFFKDFLKVSKRFDVWGYAMKQQGAVYYGGEIDPIRLSGGLIATKPEERYTQVDFVSGSLIGFNSSVVSKIGYWDEHYGMYYEDVDFCERARSTGLRVGIDTQCVYDHFETSAATQYQTIKAKQLALSRIRFFLKYANVRNILYELVRLPLTLWEYRRLIGEYGMPNIKKLFMKNKQ